MSTRSIWSVGARVPERFRAEMEERFRKVNEELHPEKTRRLEFGPVRGRHADRPAESWKCRQRWSGLLTNRRKLLWIEA
jgi:hypothetical protein